MSDVQVDLGSLGILPSEVLPTYDVPVDLIDSEAMNPNYMDDNTFNRLVEELESEGCLIPVQLAPYSGGKFKLINGEHRWRGAKSLGWRTIPATIALDDRFLDDDMRRFLMVKLNVISGKIDRERFLKLYNEQAKVYGKEQLKVLFGYTDSQAWRRLTENVTKAAIQSGIVGNQDKQGFIDAIEKCAQSSQSVESLSRVLADVIRCRGRATPRISVFSYGGENHFFIAMDDALVKAFGSLSRHAQSEKKTISDALTAAIEYFLHSR